MRYHTLLGALLALAFSSAQGLILDSRFFGDRATLSLPSDFLQAVSNASSSAIEIYCDHSDKTFENLAARWSDLDRQVPACIILPETEPEVAYIVPGYSIIWIS